MSSDQTGGPSNDRTRAEAAPDGFSALPTGTRLSDRYVIETVIGAGGFGITYLARHEALGKAYAIKEHFPRQYAYRDGASASVRPSDAPTFRWTLDRFLQEGRALARCRHPSIVGVADVFEAYGTAYMVLEYEDGRSLATWLADLGRAPTQEEIDGILVPLLDALAYLHSHDMLHRDIAPDNIMIRENGQPCLIDFGAARQAIAQRSQVLSAIVKAGYSPPEQYTTAGRAQGAWTDVYALGGTVYRALVGRRPPEATERQIEDDLLPVAEAISDPQAYRPEFLAAVDAALRLRPTERPQSIAAWHQMLGLPGPAPAYAAGGRSEPRSRPPTGVGGSTPVTGDAPVSRRISSNLPETAIGPAPSGGGMSPARLAVVGGLAALIIGVGTNVFGMWSTPWQRQARIDAENRRVEQVRKDDERRKQDEQRRLAEQQRQEEARKQSERQAEARRRADAERQEAERRRQEAERQAEAARRAEDERRRREAARTQQGTGRDVARQETTQQSGSSGVPAGSLPDLATTDCKLDKAPTIAIPACSKIIADHPKHAVAYYNRGWLLDERGHYERAISDFSKAIEIDSRYTLAYANRAHSYSRMKERANAIADYTRAIELEPSSALYHNNRGSVYYDQRDYARAEKDYDRAIALNPSYARAYSNRGLIFVHRDKDYVRAIADYSKAIQLDARYARAYLNRGWVHDEQGRYDDAIADYTKAIEIDPKLTDAYANRAYTYNRRNQHDLAIADYDKLIEINPRDHDSLNRRGRVFAHGKKDHLRAIVDYTKAIQFGPQVALYHYNRGWSQDELKKYDEAIADFTRAVELDPRYARAFENRAYSYSQKGDLDKAIADYTKAIELTPRSAIAYNNRGYVYERKGERDKAIADYRKALQIDKDYASAISNLKRLGVTP